MEITWVLVLTFCSNLPCTMTVWTGYASKEDCITSAELAVPALNATKFDCLISQRIKND
jgi:hypothetical protein